MINSALRQGQPQPWMYEAMGLAMQLNGNPKDQIERTLMSAVDFGDNADDYMYVAQYMARIGLEKRDAMPMIFSTDDLDIQARLRDAFDTSGRANPDKVLPRGSRCGELARIPEGAWV